MLMWVTLVAGSAVLAGGALMVFRTDRRWRSAHLRCGRCLTVWFGRERLCHRCNAHGHRHDRRADRSAELVVSPARG